jgi:AmiR/NasT family two-component response regulator
MKAAILTRGNDKAMQEFACRVHANAKEYDVVEVIHDTQALSKLVVNAKVDVILMTDISRLTRDRLEYEKMQQMLRGYGVTIELLDGRG